MKRLVLGALAVTLPWTPPPVSAQELAGQIERAVEQAGISGSVMVSVGGKSVFAAGYGMANREHAIPNSTDTRFRIGSIAKQFTAMGIMLLRDRGELDVDDPVGKHVGGLPEAWQRLTLHQLLTHTSGIMHSWALPGFRQTMAVPTTLDETLERFFEEPLLFAPGSDFTYSGVGYFLLAKVIEEVSGTRYSDFLSSAIFSPLGMTNSGADTPEAIVLNRADGYVRSEGDAVQNAPHIYMPLLIGGGNLYSTVGDLTRWDQALSAGALLSADGYEVLYRPERENYAYGWRVSETAGGLEMLTHTGGVPGFAAINARVPAVELEVVILTNLTPGPVRPLANEIVALVLGDLGADSG